MSRFLNVLRSWLVMVSIIAMGNTLQSFRDHTFLYEKLYTGKPDLGKKSKNCIFCILWLPDWATHHQNNLLGDLQTNNMQVPFASQTGFLKLSPPGWSPGIYFLITT